MQSDSSEMGLVIAFPDDSPSFVHGFEAGGIWQEIDGEGRLEIDRGYGHGIPVRAENIEVIRRMATARHYQLETLDCGEGWIGVKLTYRGERNRPALKLVGSDVD